MVASAKGRHLGRAGGVPTAKRSLQSHDAHKKHDTGCHDTHGVVRPSSVPIRRSLGSANDVRSHKMAPSEYYHKTGGIWNGESSNGEQAAVTAEPAVALST